MALRDWFARPRDALGVTASATVLEPDSDTERAKVRRGPQAWQKESWQGYYDIPELGDALNYRANALGRVRMVPAVRVDPREDPVPLDPDGDDELVDVITPEERLAMVAAIERLGAGALPIGEVQRLAALNLDVAGEGFLVGYVDPDRSDETWDVLSIDDLVPNPNGVGWGRRALPGSALQVQPFPPDAFVARLYHRDPRFGQAAYSQMRSVLGIIDDLRILTDSVRAAATSRIPAGILALSHGFRSGPKDETLTGQRDEAVNDPVVMNYLEHFETPIKNRKSASAVVPFMLFGDRDDVQNGIKLIEPQRAIDERAKEMRDEARDRLAIGLMLPADALTPNTGQNHWSVWHIDDESWKWYLDPGARVMVDSFTTGYYQPALAQLGIVNPKYVLWFDKSPVVTHPNAGQDYQDAYDRIEVSGEAYRKAKGISEDDAPDDEERAKRVWVKSLEGARTAPIVFPTPAEITAGDVTSEQPSGAGTTGGTPGTPSAPGPSGAPAPGPVTNESTNRGVPKTPMPTGQAALPSMAALSVSSPRGALGPRLASIESALRLRLLQASDDAVRRALERAGGTIRSFANKRAAFREMVKGVDALDVAKTLGPERVQALTVTTDDLLAGAFSGLAPHWNAWVSHAQEQALASIDQHGDLNPADAEQIRDDMAAHRVEGWAVLAAGLLALAGRMLYEPHVEPPARGEWVDFTVPPGLVSAALREAGGGTADRGAGGLLSGTTVIDALDRSGLTVETYTWVHGNPTRDFEPHLNLDGVSFTDWDDPVLTNDQDWPDTAFYSPNNGPAGPDHDSCTCLAELEIVSASDEVAANEGV